MGESSSKLLESAGEQWRTVKQLMRVGRVNGATRASVLQQAKKSREVLAEAKRRTPEGVSRRDEDDKADQIASTLEEMLDDGASAA